MIIDGSESQNLEGTDIPALNCNVQTKEREVQDAIYVRFVLDDASNSIIHLYIF